MREARRAAVVGFPVDHSLSPDIFHFISKKSGFPVEYARLAIKPGSFEKTLGAALKSSQFHGWNVTLPHKEKAFRSVHQANPIACALGAVNVVSFRGKRVLGYNTDVIGVRETLKSQGFSCRGKKAVVYGAGGGAAAVVFALGMEKTTEVVIVNRTRARARTLAIKMGRFFPKTQFTAAAVAPSDAELYVNSTPLGMKAFPGTPNLPRFEKKNVLAFDLIYRPLETEFLQLARKQGADTVNGLEMLVAQAIATWEIWFGKLPKSMERKKLQSAINRQLLRKLQ